MFFHSFSCYYPLAFPLFLFLFCPVCLFAYALRMVTTVIHEVKNSDASTDINDSIEDVNDFLVTGSAAAAVNYLDLSSAEIADREIKIWKTHTIPVPNKNPLEEWRRGVVHLSPWLGVLARRVLAIPATSAALECLFLRQVT